MKFEEDVGKKEKERRGKERKEEEGCKEERK